MAQYQHHEAQSGGVYPPVSQSYPPQPAPYVTAPPPMGYPTKDGSDYPGNQTARPQTQSKGDGFLKGCLAGLCCCWICDMCVF